jgi:uncharacterized protein (TIGR03437 family)
MKLRFAYSLFCLTAFCTGANGQKVTSVVNAASSTADISPGTLATIYGNNLAGGTALAASATTTLGGVTVTIDGVAAPLLYVTANQINFQVPYEVETGSAVMTVVNGGYQSNGFSFEVAVATPAILVDSNQNSISQNIDGSMNAPGNPAAPGSIVVVYMTGIGPLDNPLATGQLAPLSPLSSAELDYSATIGGQSVQVLYLGMTPGFLGLAQANIMMPDVADGDYPLVITIGGGNSNSPYIAIAADGVSGNIVPRKINARAKRH